MNGLTDLEQLLESLAPRRLAGEWAFCSLTPDQLVRTPTLATEALDVSRKEGLSVLLPVGRATELGLSFDGSFYGDHPRRSFEFACGRIDRSSSHSPWRGGD